MSLGTPKVSLSCFSVVSHPTHGFYTWVGGGEAIYAADGTLTQHNSLKFWDKRKRSKKYTCYGLQDYSSKISLRSASKWWRNSSLHFVYVIFFAPPVLKAWKISKSNISALKIFLLHSLIAYWDSINRHNSALKMAITGKGKFLEKNIIK